VEGLTFDLFALRGDLTTHFVRDDLMGNMQSKRCGRFLFIQVSHPSASSFSRAARRFSEEAVIIFIQLG
jgi:hypothetical protein